MPISIAVHDIKIIVVGGGNVARVKIANLVRYTDPSAIIVRAPAIQEEIKAMGVICQYDSYDPTLLDGAGLVYTCTDNPTVNLQVRDDARMRRILICVADSPANCDFTSPAIYKEGEMSVAVSSNATSAISSVKLRDRIKAFLST